MDRPRAHGGVPDDDAGYLGRPDKALLIPPPGTQAPTTAAVGKEPRSGVLNRRAPLGARGPDFYATPPEAVHALLDVYRPPHRIWEPACGDGAIVKVLRAAGHHVVATDLNRWGCPDSTARCDFLLEQEAPPGCRCIITNPPFKLAEAFIEHAFRMVPHVVMLCRLAFLESERRTHLLEESGLRRVLVFRNRLPMMHRHSWTGPRNSSSTAFAWFCWQSGYNGRPEVQRISWQPARNGGARGKPTIDGDAS